MAENINWGDFMGMPVTDMSTWGVNGREPNNELDRQAFLNLLITQLRHQDPLNPMDDRDFIAQMAQFSALEQMIQLNQTFERTQAFGMIGKVISAEFFNPHSEEWVSIENRFVTSVIRQGDRVFLTVLADDGTPIDVPFNAVHEVSEDFFVSQQLLELQANVQGQRAAALVGQWVQAIITQGEQVIFVEGRVDAVKLAENGNQAVLVVGNREVFLWEIFSVSDDYLLLNSPYFSHGLLTDVRIINDRAYLVFDHDPNHNNHVFIRRINHATEALAYVGRHINDSGVSGTVTTVTIRGGIPFLNVRQADGSMAQIDFLNYLANRAEGISTSGPGGTTPPIPPDNDDGGDNP